MFFEMLTRQRPITAAWLMALRLGMGRHKERLEGIAAPVVTLATVIAFGFGAAATLVAKQILALVLAEPNAGAQFLSHLRFYTGIDD